MSDTYTYLYSDTSYLQTSTISAGDSQAFRHFLTLDKDVSLSMTVFAGMPQVHVSFNHSMKTPNKTSNQYSTLKLQNS